MQPLFSNALSKAVENHIKLPDSRRATLAWLALLIMPQGMICLWRLAADVATPAQTDSGRRRFYRFFQSGKRDGAAACRAADLLELGGKPWVLAVDRTNWESGQTTINILMVPVIWNGMGTIAAIARHLNKGQKTILKGACRLGQNAQASSPAIRLVIMRIASGELLALACSSKVLPGDASSNSKTAPVQLYHLGLWFDSPVDANKAGCGSKMTPLNSSHNAGVQILNTSNFPNLNGPLRGVTR